MDILARYKWLFLQDQTLRQAEKQKFAREARDAKMAEAGTTTEEIKKTRRKMKFHQEDHKDDCGSDLCPLEFVAWIATLGADGGLGAAIN